MDRIVVGQRVPVPAAKLPPGTPGSRTESLKLRLRRPDGSVRVVTAPNSPLVRDPDDALAWRYTGTADRDGVWEWQWEFEGAVLSYGRFRVLATGFVS